MSRNQSLYNAHCATFSRALDLCGIERSTHEHGIATRGDTSPIALFRAFRPHRDASANLLRDMVALSIRMDRMSNKLKGVTAP